MKTTSIYQTKRLAENIAKNRGAGTIICLAGDLGSGKTTFAQGILEYFEAEKPYTSPTFLIMKEYNLLHTKEKNNDLKKNIIKKIIHIDAYRITSTDLLNLGWQEFSINKNNLLIIEWPEKIKEILPKNIITIRFTWLDEITREITIKE